MNAAPVPAEGIAGLQLTGATESHHCKIRGAKSQGALQGQTEV